MANTLKFGNGQWATKDGSTLAYNDENGNFKPLPFTFDRASSATRVNKDGLIETVGADQPRVDFLNDSKGALKLEPSRTNYILKSDDILSTYQSQNGDVSDASEPINGFNNSIQIEYDASNSLVYKRDFTPTIGTEYTISCFVQMNDNSAPIHTVDANSGDFCLINNNTVVSASDIKTERLGSTNLYRVSATKTASDTNNRFGIVKYSTQSSKGFKVTGFQLEIGYPTSYIPTQGSAVTRVADVCGNAGNDQVFNDNEGVLYVETKGFTDLLTQSNYIQLSKNGELSATNSLIIQHRNNGYLRVYVNGFGTPDIHFNINIDFTQNHKIAVLYKLNGYKLFIDGVEQNLYLTPTQAVFIGLDNLSFDLRGDLSWNASIKDVRVYNTALTDQELQALTT